MASTESHGLLGSPACLQQRGLRLYSKNPKRQLGVKVPKEGLPISPLTSLLRSYTFQTYVLAVEDPFKKVQLRRGPRSPNLQTFPVKVGEVMTSEIVDPASEAQHHMRFSRQFKRSIFLASGIDMLAQPKTVSSVYTV